MRKMSLVIVGVFFLHIIVSGQAIKLYNLANNSFERMNLTFSSGNSNTHVFHASKPELNIYGNSGSEKIDPVITHMINGTHHIIVNESERFDSGSRSLSNFLFKDRNENSFDLHLPSGNPLQLNLNYAVGDAFVNLSDLAIESLKINTGSADVYVSYNEGRSNLIEMDTFIVEVDMGSLTIDMMDHAKAKNVIAEVGFGGLSLNYSNYFHSTSFVQASVAAGNLLITIPHDDIPVKITIHDSPLCHVKIPNSFTRIDEHVFVSPGYYVSKDEILEFDLNVGLGRIKFQTN